VGRYLTDISIVAYAKVFASLEMTKFRIFYRFIINRINL